jgi:7-keto-8-aminopelargonate synthetase-like enzyme
VDALRRILGNERHRFASALIVTESLFSMDGDIAPLADLRKLADEFDAALMVDDAHAIGILGPNGRGLCAELGMMPDVLTGTFGKAFGASGAFVLGQPATIQLIENLARSFVFSTAPSPTIAAAALAAVDLVEAADPERVRLRMHVQTLRQGLRALDYRVVDGDRHIIPVILGTPDAATELSSRLLELGVFVHAIRPPTVPQGTSRLRVTPMSSHKPEQIAQALEAFRDAR